MSVITISNAKKASFELCLCAASGALGASVINTPVSAREGALFGVVVGLSSRGLESVITKCLGIKSSQNGQTKDTEILTLALSTFTTYITTYFFLTATGVLPITFKAFIKLAFATDLSAFVLIITRELAKTVFSPIPNPLT